MSGFQFKLSPEPDLMSLHIAGERIALRTIAQTDAQLIFQEFTATITRYMIPKVPDSIEETRAFISSSLASLEQRDNLQLVILDKETGEFLGCCGLHGRGDVKNPELGIWLKASAHGKGYGREAIHTLVNWVREAIVLESFIYPVDKRNIPSRKIPESLAGQVIEERIDIGMAGNELDEMVYRVMP